MLTLLAEKNTELLNKIDGLEYLMEKMQLKCNVLKILKRHYTETQIGFYSKRINTQSIMPSKWTNNPTCWLGTITFDPKKFQNHVTDRLAQRQYIATVLGDCIEKQYVDDLIGCFELHDNGRVHAHIMFEKHKPMFYAYLRDHFTNNEENCVAINFKQKQQQEAYDYIKKNETKDPDEIDNYFWAKGIWPNLEYNNN